MEKAKQYLIKSGLVIAVLLVYLLVVSTHIFYLPRIAVHAPHSNNSIFKRKNENVQTTNSLDRIAKATFNAGKTTRILKMSCFGIPFRFSAIKFKNTSQKISLVNTNPLCSYRYTYLSCCVFRI